MEESAKNVNITTNIDDVLNSISGKENFIAIGELHNSRSAIKFIIDNINKLAPKDKRKTHLLTEFFPTDKKLIPNTSNKNNYLKAKIISKLGNIIRNDINQRESDKSENEKIYTIENLYKMLFERGISIVSVEQQDENSEQLYRDIKNDNIKAYKKRVEMINSHALYEAVEILKKDKNARILFFAGMGHTASSTIKKFDKESCKLIEEETFEGINELMRDKGYNGLSISIHDPDLCIDKDFIKKIRTKAECFTKYESNDNCVTFDKPDFLLFLDTPSEAKKIIKKGNENIFISGKHEFSNIQNSDYREKILTQGTKEIEESNTKNSETLLVKKKKKKKKNKKKRGLTETSIQKFEEKKDDTNTFVSNINHLKNSGSPIHSNESRKIPIEEIEKSMTDINNQYKASI